MNERYVIPEIIRLNAAAEAMGPDLRIEKLSAEIVRLLEADFPSTKFRLLIWDEQKKRFNPDASGDAPPEMKGRPAGDSAPFFSGQAMVVPLVNRQKLLGILMAGICENAQEKERIIGFARLAEIILSNAAVFIESEIRSVDMFRFNVLSRALNPTANEEEVLRILVEAISGMIKFDACGFLVFGKKERILFVKSRAMLPEDALAFIEKNLVESVSNLTRVMPRQQGLRRIIQAGDGKADGRGMSSFTTSPLITKGKVLGVVAVYGTTNEGFTVRDQRNLSLLSSHGAVALENAMLYGDLKRTYFSIINALASAIEAKDEYTRGHSDLVSRYSVAIAQTMDLAPSTVESIQIAGLLHDLGKIGVPEEILGKKGKLTDGEFDIVKGHPEIAMKILGPVEFPHFSDQGSDPAPELTLSLFEQADLSADVKLMIYHHHEKYAGGGYPKGLAGEEIPLGARILSVADTFEALTADRPYRKAFPLDEAMKILKELSGKQLDPVIVRLFTGIVELKGIEALKNLQGL